MKLKMLLSIMLLSLMLLQSIKVTALSQQLVTQETPPNVLFIIDDINATPDFAIPVDRRRPDFSTVNDMLFHMKKLNRAFRIQFSLEEDSVLPQFRCYHSLAHLTVDCITTTNQVFSYIKRAKDNNVLTIQSEEKSVQDFIELLNIRFASQMKEIIEKFMKEKGLNTLVFDLVVTI